MQIQSVTNYNNSKTYQPTYKAHIKYSQITNQVKNMDNYKKIGIIGLLTTFTTKLLNKNSTDNYSQSNIDSEVNEDILFKKNQDGSFEELHSEKVIDSLKDKPELLAQWFLNTNCYGVNYFGQGVGAEEYRIMRANKMHKALKAQPDVLYEIYMTPTCTYRDMSGAFNRASTTICKFANDKKYINTVLKNVLDLATNSDLSLLRSKKLLELYRLEAKYVDEDLGRKFEQLIEYLNPTLIQQKTSDNPQFLCAKGVEKYLHTDEDIQSMWKNKYRDFYDVNNVDSM